MVKTYAALAVVDNTLKTGNSSKSPNGLSQGNKGHPSSIVKDFQKSFSDE